VLLTDQSLRVTREPILPPVPEIVDAPRPQVFPSAAVRHAGNGRNQ
jgi:hypothetical protein